MVIVVLQRNCRQTNARVARWLVLASLAWGMAGPARAQSSLFTEDAIAFGRSPIDYYGPAEQNRIADLAAELAAGKRQLEFDPQHGYLPSLLAALDIPVESQVLVFSKSSLNQQLITPQTPRAIYFNDDVYVAFVPGAASLELSAIDRSKGALFYTLLQGKQERPRFQREERCVVCHAAQSTLQVPGHMLKSFETTETGKLVSGYSRVTQDTPYENRWGGWYVSGKPTDLVHHGNLVGAADYRAHATQPGFKKLPGNLAGFFDTERYLSPYSDIAALLVLDHQVHGQNLCIRLNLESQLNLPLHETVEQLARYLLLADAPPLDSAVEGSSGYTQRWQRRTMAAEAALSHADDDTDAGSPAFNLRRLNLKDRVFEQPLSYLIETQVFQSLPAAAKTAVARRFTQVLGPEPPAWLKLTPAQQRHVRRLLAKSLPEMNGAVESEHAPPK